MQLPLPKPWPFTFPAILIAVQCMVNYFNMETVNPKKHLLEKTFPGVRPDAITGKEVIAVKRGFGILMPLFSLPSRFGIGDFGESANRFADLLAEHGAAYWQLLPLNAGNPQNGESPYFSISAFAINPLLISLEKLCDLGLLTNEEISKPPRFPDNEVDYDEVRKMKMTLLMRAAARFPGGVAFNEFCRTNGHWLEAFSMYSVLRKQYGCPWPGWPAGPRDHDRGTVTEFAEKNKEAIRIVNVLQFIAFFQWQQLRQYCCDRHLAIIGDMPIYVSLDSADAWANPGFFKLDAQGNPRGVSGVPPDYFSATGQLWNNPVYNWDSQRLDNFRWWVLRFGHLFYLYDVVRIDHFRGLVRFWEVPAGSKNAVQGTWEDVPTYELFDRLMAAFKNFPVICEDLGIITDDVREAIRRLGFPGMRVLQFAFDQDNPGNPHLPINYDGNCIVYTGTHDTLPTFGWLKTATDRIVRARIARSTGKISGHAETVWNLIELALQSEATIAIFPLQDILTLDEKSRINNPAAINGNWRWRWSPSRNPAKRPFERLQGLARQYHRENAFPWK
jgi:4-alpha-glucanotransferase